jgi:methylated-DNA-[protein]-cysteine S-methyltransferase
MEMTGGSCRFGLWYVHVWWKGDTIFRVRFSREPLAGQAHPLIVQFLAGRSGDLSKLHSVATEPDHQYSDIYRQVRKIPYGRTSTYAEIAAMTGTNPRLVGLAMRRNPTPLVVPCHRVVSASGLGGFTPSIDIKESLLRMEKKNKRRLIQ